jgi:hypothetical protein
MNVERMRSAFLHLQHGGKAATERVAELKKTVGAHASYVGQNNPAPMEPCANIS